jgi:hypothetical protein
MRLATVQLHQQADPCRVDPALEIERVEHAVATAHGPRVATSFVTRGMAALGQPEVVFTWCGPQLLPVPSAAVTSTLQALGRATAAGLRLRAGSSFYLGEGALLDGVGLSGLVFVPTRAMAGLRLVLGAVQAIAVTGAELALIGRTSVHRVLSRLGAQHRRFPWPLWSCPRMSVARADEATDLEGTRRIPLPGVVAALDGATLSIRVPSAVTIELARHLVTGNLVVPADPDPSADALLVWDADRGRTQVYEATRRTGHRIAGGFVRFERGDQRAGRVVEDGFALALDPVSRERLCASLVVRKPWRERAIAGEVHVDIV